MNLLAPLFLWASLAGVNESTTANNSSSPVLNITEQTLNVTNSTLNIGSLFRRASSFKGGLNCTITADSHQSYSLEITQGNDILKLLWKI